MKPGADFDLILTISNVKYGCMLESSRGFQKRCINEFAARTATGPPTYSDDDIYSLSIKRIGDMGWAILTILMNTVMPIQEIT